MGATVRPREFDADQPSQTEQLANWISRVRTKKVMCRRSRRRNLRVEAVLTSVLSKAESELRNKQVTRIMRWQQMKQRLLEDMAYKDGGYRDGELYKDGDGCLPDKKDCCGRAYNGGEQPHSDACWPDVLCPELSSLDSFMSQLGEIKVPLQRWRKCRISWSSLSQLDFSRRPPWIGFSWNLDELSCTSPRRVPHCNVRSSLFPVSSETDDVIVEMKSLAITLEYIWIFFILAVSRRLRWK